MKKEKSCNKIKITQKVIFILLFIFFICVFIVSATKIILYIKDAKNNEKLLEEISEFVQIKEVENNNKYSIDFNSLKQKNEEAVGFLKVQNTDIEHIVVRAKDNSYYLNHNFNKEQNNAGWIFADYRNKLDGTDKNIIIYGHNMKNGTMFSTLKNILNKDWQEDKDNRFITFVTENGVAIYEVFSVYEIEEEDYYITTELSEKDFSEFKANLKSRSIYDFDTNIENSEQIITLSTCGNNNNNRVVLHAAHCQWGLFQWSLYVPIDKIT